MNYHVQTGLPDLFAFPFACLLVEFVVIQKASLRPCCVTPRSSPRFLQRFTRRLARRFGADRFLLAAVTFAIACHGILRRGFRGACANWSTRFMRFSSLVNIEVESVASHKAGLLPH